MKSIKRPSKHTRKQLEVQMEAGHAVQEDKLKPVVLEGNCSKARRTRQGSRDKVRLYSGIFVNPQDSEGTNFAKSHEDHIAGKGHHSMNHSNLVHKFISMQKAMKIPDAI